MSTTFIEKAASGLRKAAAELEEFQLKLALGKAEASDKYEEIKKSFHKTITDFISGLGQKARQSGLQARLEELRVQLALGKAETRDAFAAQEKKITALICEIEGELEKMLDESELYINLKSELVKFRIMLDILRVHYALGKMEIREDLAERRRMISDQINNLIASYSRKRSDIEKGWKNLSEEVNEIYSQLSKAFTFNR